MAEYRLQFSADSQGAENSIKRLRAEIRKVTDAFEKAEIGSDDFLKAASDLSGLNQGLKTATSAVVDLDRAYRNLGRAVNDMQKIHDRTLRAGEKYHKSLLDLVNDGFRQEDAIRDKNYRAELDDWDRRLKIAVATKNKINAQQRAIMEFRAGMGERGAIPGIASPILGGADIEDSPLFLRPASLGRMEERLKKLQQEARRIAPNSGDWRKLNKEIIQLEKGIGRIQRMQKPMGLAQRAGAAGGAFLYGGGLGGGIGSALGGITGGLIGGVPGAFAGAGLGQLADNLSTALAGITSQASAVMQMQRGLAMASVDAKDFAEAQATVASMSQRLLMPLEQATRLFTQLRVNTKQYNLSVQDTAKIMEGTALAIMATGGSTEDLDGAMRAVVQILSKGGVQAEELRGQLGERFPGAVVKFAQANKLSFEELQRGLEQGQIGIKEFVTFAESNYADYAEFSKQLATAPEFAGRRLQIALEEIGREVGALFAPIGAEIQDTFTTAIKAVSDFVKNNRAYLRQLIADFGSIVGPIVKIFGQLLGVIAQFATQVGRVFQALFSQIRQAVGMATIGEAKARLDRARAATAGMERPSGNVRGGGPFRELSQAEAQFKALGGQAAWERAQAPLTPSNLVFGGPGAGASMERQGADGASGRKKANNELKQYIGDRIAILQSRQRAETAAIEANLLLSERDRTIQKADIAFKYANLIAEEKLRVAERDSLQYRLEDREEFLAEQKQLIDIEKQTARSQFQRDIAGGLIGQNEALKNSYEELLIRLDAIKAGRGEVTEATKAEAEIARALNGLTKEQADGLQPVIDQTRQYANEVDRLNKLIQEQVTIQEKQASLRRIEADLTGQIQAATPLGGRGLSFGFIGAAGERAAETFDLAIGAGKTEEQAKADAQYFGQLQNQLTLLESRNNAIKSSITGIGDAFATAMTAGVASLIDGTASAEEVFSNFLKSVGQTLLQAAQQMIATYITIGIARIFAGLGGGGGDLASSFTGKFDLSGTSFATMPKSFGFSALANGGIAPGGFKAFANGGIATSPTLGLIGEGRYNEAIVPLPDGKSIPVMMRGEQPSSRDLIGGSMNQAMAPILNMSFESTTINGVEYVSRDQLEQAMMDTRKAAAREGATRGATLAIDKLQQSPSTRRRIGLS